VKYMMLVYGDERAQADVPQHLREERMREWYAYTEAMKKAGAHLAGAPLQPVRSASTVRVRGGKTLTTDGPFAETKEQLAGYYLIDVPDLDAALAWAARCPGARDGSMEVRPVWELPPSP
jgi:hypothetical protein